MPGGRAPGAGKRGGMILKFYGRSPPLHHFANERGSGAGEGGKGHGAF